MVRRGKLAQSSVEYIFIVAFALMIVIPGAYVFSQYTTGSQAALRNAQIYKTGNDIVDSAELMYSVGENSWQTLEITFPEGVDQVKVFNTSNGITELVIYYQDRYLSESVFFSDVLITNSSSTSSSIVDCTNGCVVPFHEGQNHVRVESLTNSLIILRNVK